MAPKHSRGRSVATCEVSELREISDYANQITRQIPGPGRLADSLAELDAFRNLAN